jgi:hypothetical protein
MSFANYKKTRTDLTRINKKVDEIAEGTRKSYKDDRFWRPVVDKAGSGAARIRFLPAAEGEDLPWVQFHQHNFDIDGTYFIEMCPTTLGRDCPVCKANGILWKTEIEDNQKIVKTRKRKLCYVSNILVLKDKEVPENEGKVFLYQYGQKIFEKIKGALKPKDEDDPAVNVFDFWEGADFSLEIKKVAGYRNYDDSKFRAASPLFKGDDTELEKIFKVLYALQPFVADAKFKSYEVLEKQFNETVTGVKGKVQKKADELFPDTEKPATVEAPVKKERKPKDTSAEPPWEEAVRKPKANAKKTPKTEKNTEEVPVESDSTLNYYEKLAEDE